MISVLQLSIAGSITCFIFLLLRSWICRYTAANFVVKVYTIVLLSFIIPIFYLCEIYDNTYEIFSQGYALIMVEKSSIEEIFYHIIKNKLFINVLQILLLIGIFFYFFCVCYRFLKLKKDLKYHSFSIYGVTKWNQILNEICEKKISKKFLCLQQHTFLSLAQQVFFKIRYSFLLLC